VCCLTRREERARRVDELVSAVEGSGVTASCSARNLHKELAVRFSKSTATPKGLDRTTDYAALDCPDTVGDKLAPRYVDLRPVRGPMTATMCGCCLRPDRWRWSKGLVGPSSQAVAGQKVTPGMAGVAPSAAPRARCPPRCAVDAHDQSRRPREADPKSPLQESSSINSRSCGPWQNSAGAKQKQQHRR